MNTSLVKLRNDNRNRADIGYLAFVLHRVSGLAITLFLPLHFLLLGTALGGESALQAGLGWTDHPFFKIADGPGAWACLALGTRNQATHYRAHGVHPTAPAMGGHGRNFRPVGSIAIRAVHGNFAVKRNKVGIPRPAQPPKSYI